MIPTASTSRTTPRAPATPPGCLIYAVGDIHGRADLLERLLADIAADARPRPAQRRALVFLGDYVDRGPDSRHVIDILIAGLPARFQARFLMGNHEELMLRSLEDKDLVPLWLVNGADATLASYGVAPTGPGERVRLELAAALPAAHQAFFRSLELHVSFGDYLFVHAGLRPGVPLERQDRRDLLWIREEFLYSEEDFGAVVVHGHTPVKEPVLRPNRIGIDTMAWASGRLTALRLEGTSRAFLSTG